LRRHILPLYLKDQRLTTDPLSITTLGTTTTQEVGTNPTLMMDLVAYITTLTAETTGDIIKQTTPINILIQIPLGIFMEELSMCMLVVMADIHM
jgi:hypothetical protein